MQDISKKNIVIIGHTGRMGAFFMRKLQGMGMHVLGVDVPLSVDELKKTCNKADLALFCVPAAVLEEVLIKVCPHLPSHCILVDITSVKVRALECMQTHWQGPIVGTHPLFGHKPPRGSELKVAIVPAENTDEQYIELVEQLFSMFDCRSFRCSAKKHDKAMSAIQNLNFITSLVYFAALAEDEDLLPFITPSFRRRQDAAQKLLTEDAQLFEGLFHANPYSAEYVAKYRECLDVAAIGDIEKLANRAAWWWK